MIWFNKFDSVVYWIVELSSWVELKVFQWISIVSITSINMWWTWMFNGKLDWASVNWFWLEHLQKIWILCWEHHLTWDINTNLINTNTRCNMWKYQITWEKFDNANVQSISIVIKSCKTKTIDWLKIIHFVQVTLTSKWFFVSLIICIN